MQRKSRSHNTMLRDNRCNFGGCLATPVKTREAAAWWKKQGDPEEQGWLGRRKCRWWQNHSCEETPMTNTRKLIWGDLCSQKDALQPSCFKTRPLINWLVGGHRWWIWQGQCHMTRPKGVIFCNFHLMHCALSCWCTQQSKQWNSDLIYCGHWQLFVFFKPSWQWNF